MVLELDRKYVREYYGGDFKAAEIAQDGLLWTTDRIKSAFRFGHGTEADLRRYMRDNAQYAVFVEV